LPAVNLNPRRAGEGKSEAAFNPLDFGRRAVLVSPEQPMKSSRRNFPGLAAGSCPFFFNEPGPVTEK
jgi:hypothetical protein